jgi:hypothetical protein
MSNFLLKTAIRSLFVVTSRTRALKKCQEIQDKYLQLAHDLSPQAGQLGVKVPPLRGVDEDMRRWSFYMILEHNTIVNRSITATVSQLARGEPLSGAALINPKTGVMPSESADISQLAAFRKSVQRHLETVPSLGPLRKTATAPHPIFGDFDAHKWNCMFAFHLGLHCPQAEHVVRIAKGAKQ